MQPSLRSLGRERGRSCTQQGSPPRIRTPCSSSPSPCPPRGSRQLAARPARSVARGHCGRAAQTRPGDCRRRARWHRPIASRAIRWLLAYDLLLTEGYLTAQRGAGTFVAAALPRKRDAKRAPAEPGTDRRLSRFWRATTPLPRLSSSGPAPSFDFRMGTPDIKALPVRDLAAFVWPRIARAREVAAALGKSGRARAAARLRSRAMCRSRAPWPAGRKTSSLRRVPSRRSICSRACSSRPGRTTVAVENPGYPPARLALAAAGARLAPVPVDADGMVVLKLPRHARVISVTPSHQFPLGSVLSTERRVALLDFARRNGAVIVEDDYDGEFRFSGRPLDALQTLDRDESVFYVGTFSKSLFPAIRVGYIVAPSWARPALIAARRSAEGPHSIVAQEALADFITEGHLTRHVRKMRRIRCGAARRASRRARRKSRGSSRCRRWPGCILRRSRAPVSMRMRSKPARARRGRRHPVASQLLCGQGGPGWHRLRARPDFAAGDRGGAADPAQARSEVSTRPRRAWTG